MSFRFSAATAVAVLTLLSMTSPSSALDVFGWKVSLPARSNTVHNVPHVSVEYSDLNLDNSAGARALVSRIRVAAKQVCGPEPMRNDFVSYSAYRRCTSHAQDDAVAAINKPTVTAAYKGLTAQGTTAAVIKKTD